MRCPLPVVTLVLDGIMIRTLDALEGQGCQNAPTQKSLVERAITMQNLCDNDMREVRVCGGVSTSGLEAMFAQFA